MFPILLPILLLQTPSSAYVDAQPLGFYSQSFPYKWDTIINLRSEVDGLKLNTIFFNKRSLRANFMKDADFGTRAQIEVTNSSKANKMPNFAVAVLDEDNRLLGVATGGSKITGVKPGETETFDLNFSRVTNRLPKGTRFILTIEF